MQSFRDRFEESSRRRHPVPSDHPDHPDFSGDPSENEKGPSPAQFSSPPVSDALLASILNPSDGVVTLKRIETELSELLGLVGESYFASLLAGEKSYGEGRSLAECVFDVCALGEAYHRLESAGHCSSHITALIQATKGSSVAVSTRIPSRIFMSLRAQGEVLYEELVGAVDSFGRPSSQHFRSLEALLDEVWDIFLFLP